MRRPLSSAVRAITRREVAQVVGDGVELGEPFHADHRGDRLVVPGDHHFDAVGGVGHEPGNPPGAGGGHAEVLAGAHRETV